MTSIHHAPQRTSPPHLKKTAARSHRATVLPRPISSPKLTSFKSGKSKPVVEDSIPLGQEDDDMATSFLQYWYAGTPA